MRIYNAYMSAVFTGIVVHELTHAVFYDRLDFIGFGVGGHIAGVCGVAISRNTEPIAIYMGTLATLIVIALTLTWGRK